MNKHQKVNLDNMFLGVCGLATRSFSLISGQRAILLVFMVQFAGSA
jgi:hypothetical protein